MNIGFVVHHFDDADGTGGHAVELLSRLNADHDVTLYVAALRAPVPRWVRVIRVPALRGSAYARILRYPAAFATVRKQHDVVHAQGSVMDNADVVTTHIVLSAWRVAARSAHIVSRPGERIFGGFVVARERSLVRASRAVIVPSQRAAADVVGQTLSQAPGGSVGKLKLHRYYLKLRNGPADQFRYVIGMMFSPSVANWAFRPIGLPILIGGPLYLSTARWAMENPGAAVLVTSNEAEVLRDAFLKLRDAKYVTSIAAAGMAAGSRDFGVSNVRRRFAAVITRRL